MLHSKWILVGVVIMIAFISMARFPFDTHFTDRHHNQLVHFTVYPASSLPEGLRSPLLHFAPPKCMRVKSAHWTEDALILDSEYNRLRFEPFGRFSLPDNFGRWIPPFPPNIAKVYYSEVRFRDP